MTHDGGHRQLEEVRRQGEQDRAEAHKDMSEVISCCPSCGRPSTLTLHQKAQAEIDGLRQALANTQAERMALQNARDQDIDDAERQIEVSFLLVFQHMIPDGGQCPGTAENS
jgi:hypothetical protein